MKKVVGLLANKFVITALVFGGWMMWFDQNDYSSQKERSENLQDTKDNIAYLEKEIAKMEGEHFELTNNPKKLEQYAREQYKMKRDNEDIYIIERK